MTYTTIRRLGGGQFGDVYLERDNSIDRLCAKKVMSQAGGSSDLIGEAALMAATDHDNVAKVYQADYENGLPYIRMEYLEGGSVADTYSKDPIEVATALQMLTDACRGLSHLHSHNIIHRDIKTGNLLLSAQGRLKIGDFGLAVQASNSSSMPMFYEPHTSPEEIRSGAHLGSVAADVYALGVTAYRMLNGEPMFWGVANAVPDLSKAIMRGQVPDRALWQPHVHPTLRRAVIRAINPKVPARFATAGDFRHALEKAWPVVSWGLSSGPGRLEWVGRVADKVGWSADLTTDGEGRFSFEIRKLASNGKPRRSVRDCQANVPLGSALAAAAGVLARVATTGA